MKQFRIVQLLAFACVLSICLVPGFQHDLRAEDTRIVRIYATISHGVETRIEPKDLWITPGTVVIFNNWGKTEVKFSFKEGPKCDKATEAAMGFKLDGGCFINTLWIPYGGTTSLKFNEPGKYNYTILFKDLNTTTEGSILVKPRE